MQVQEITINNMNVREIEFLIGLYIQSFPCLPYKLNMPYKLIRYYLEKNIERGVLELDNYSHRVEISCHFTVKGYDVVNGIKEYLLMMRAKMKKLFKILYIKWVLGQCHHACLLCDYKEICLEHLEV
nr:MAG TPA: hypothetical protein [Caudoviricetes sp.]